MNIIGTFGKESKRRISTFVRLGRKTDTQKSPRKIISPMKQFGLVRGMGSVFRTQDSDIKSVSSEKIVEENPYRNDVQK